MLTSVHEIAGETVLVNNFRCPEHDILSLMSLSQCCLTQVHGLGSHIICTVATLPAAEGLNTL